MHPAQSAPASTPGSSPSGPLLSERFTSVRAQTLALCRPLEVEDFVVSSMPDVSPTKWHLAHTSWFFETFVLADHDPRYRSPDSRFAYLFNSYYVQAGERHCRAQRGLATRPTVHEVYAYREHVDGAILRLLESIGDRADHAAVPLIELGLHHEQQHQELLLMDIKHVFWTNPLRPVYRRHRSVTPPPAATGPTAWCDIPEGIEMIGYDGSGFAFDNERPAHRVFVQPCRIASRLVTNGEYLEFVRDSGYARPELWLSAGWDAVRANQWQAPLYWERGTGADDWQEFTLSGMHPLDPAAPVCHVSYFEADAYARWAGRVLPTEVEWEIAGAHEPVGGAFRQSHRFAPRPVSRPSSPPLAAAPPSDAPALDQLYGDVWQWTASAYLAYPGYHPATGAVGEYNGKWMADQWVLRGASFATPASHARRTYRNFYPSLARWQFAGIRLADRS